MRTQDEIVRLRSKLEDDHEAQRKALELKAKEVCACVCVCVRAYVRACVCMRCAYVCLPVRARARACVGLGCKGGVCAHRTRSSVRWPHGSLVRRRCRCIVGSQSSSLPSGLFLLSV